MDFSQIKNILFQSEEIGLIPDKWEESVPVKCVINGEEYDAFLYWKSIGDTVELKRMIGVNSKTGKLITLEANQLVERFGLSSVAFEKEKIENYDEFFEKKERYEEIYCQICASIETISRFGKEELSLLRYLSGKTLYLEVFSRIAKEYIEKLGK